MTDVIGQPGQMLCASNLSTSVSGEPLSSDEPPVQKKLGPTQPPTPKRFFHSFNHSARPQSSQFAPSDL